MVAITTKRWGQRVGRRAFTLVELLTTLGILAVAAALLLPAVQQAREAARRSQCRGRLANLLVAVHQYHDVHRCYPPGRVINLDPRFAGNNPPCTAGYVDRGPLMALLPFLDQLALYERYNESVSVFSPENSTIQRTSLAGFLCPSDAASHELAVVEGSMTPPFDRPVQSVLARSSYVGMFGVFILKGMPAYYPNCRVPPAVMQQIQGVFSDRAPLRVDHMTDGLSQTVFLTERTAESRTGMESMTDVNRFGQGWWTVGNIGDALVVSHYPPNAFRRLDVYAINARLYGASSGHSGGVHVALGDGSVRWISDDVDSWPHRPENGEAIGCTLGPDGAFQGCPPYGLWQRLSTIHFDH